MEVLGQGKPVIALINVDSRKVLFESVPKLHYIVLNGYDRASQTLYYTNTDGGRSAMSFDEFYQKWD